MRKTGRVRAFSHVSRERRPDLPRRHSGPALAGMGEGTDPAIADEPGDLRDCEVALFEIAGGEIGAELVEISSKVRPSAASFRARVRLLTPSSRATMSICAFP